MQKLTFSSLLLAVGIISITAISCSKKVDTLPQTISFTTSSARADGFSIKTTNDFFSSYDNPPGNNGFVGQLFNQKTGADSIVLHFEYGSKAMNDLPLPNVTDAQIKDNYLNARTSNDTVINIDRTRIGNSKSSILVTYKNNGTFMDVYLFNANLSQSAMITTDSQIPISNSQQDEVKNIYKSFQFK